MKQFFIKRWFLLALAMTLLTGIAFSPSLVPLGQAKTLRYALVATVLFIMALPLRTTAVWDALRKPTAPLLAIGVNLGILPLFAWAISFGLPLDTARGLLVTSTTPCTLASAAVWTRRAGGNDAIALVVTVVTNLLCFLATPLWLAAMLGASDFRIDLAPMIQKLALLVVLPIFAAQLLRRWSIAAHWADRKKTPLSVWAQVGVLTMVFIGAINVGEKIRTLQGSVVAWDWSLMLGAVLLVHLAMLAAGHLLSHLAGVSREDRIAVGFAGSQKTLLVGLQVSLDVGVTILPMITYHVSQLLVDTLIADWLKKRGE